MQLNRFKLRIILQSLIIAGTGYIAVEFMVSDHLWITRITLLMVWAGLVINLIHYTTRMNRTVEAFLSSLKYMDNIPGKDEGDQSFRELNLSLNQIIDDLKEVKRDREIQANYFRNTIEHIGTGLITYEPLGKIGLYNRAAKDLLKLPFMNNLRDLKKIKSDLEYEITALKPGENLLSRLIIEGELKRVVFRKAEFKILDEELFVVSMQDIKSQLEEEELEAWQKLISILRHEIMNSVTPLSSLSRSLKKIVKKVHQQLPQKEAEMLIEGLDSIARRSDGLMSFVQAYKTLTSLPKPDFSEFPVSKLIEDTLTLFRQELKSKKVKTQILAQENLMILADYNMVSQVMINLLKNALEALEETGNLITIRSGKSESGGLFIQVEDNGSGIPPEIIDKIFTPFYTTRESGTGIGLSLARQIMRMHKGTISVSSEPGKGSQFILHF